MFSFQNLQQQQQYQPQQPQPQPQFSLQQYQVQQQQSKQSQAISQHLSLPPFSHMLSTPDNSPQTVVLGNASQTKQPLNNFPFQPFQNDIQPTQQPLLSTQQLLNQLSNITQQPLVNIQQFLSLNNPSVLQQPISQSSLYENYLPQQPQQQHHQLFEPLPAQQPQQYPSLPVFQQSQAPPSIKMPFNQQQFSTTLTNKTFESILLPKSQQHPTNNGTCAIRQIPTNAQFLPRAFEVVSSTGPQYSNHHYSSNAHSNTNISNGSSTLFSVYDDESYDSFFRAPNAPNSRSQNTRTNKNRNTTMSGKSFFLVSNYKKKLIASLDPKDQVVLVGMKKSKKFNFSKNVIKQFLKSMQSEIHYIYQPAQQQEIQCANNNPRRTYFTKNCQPLNSDLCNLREQLKQFLACNTYTHSSIKKLITHNYYSLYFKDFLDYHTSEWIESGKTKYKQEQTVMIQFLKLAMRNRKLLIFLSEHDPSKQVYKDTKNTNHDSNNDNEDTQQQEQSQQKLEK